MEISEWNTINSGSTLENFSCLDFLNCMQVLWVHKKLVGDVLFLTAAVINHYKLSGLKPPQFIILYARGQKYEIDLDEPKSRVNQTVVLFGGSRAGTPLPCLVHLLAATCASSSTLPSSNPAMSGLPHLLSYFSNCSFLVLFCFCFLSDFLKF